MEVSGWLEELDYMRDVWKFVWIEDGAQCVMILGTTWMPVWLADSWDTLDTVRYLNCILKVCVAIAKS